MNSAKTLPEPEEFHRLIDLSSRERKKDKEYNSLSEGYKRLIRRSRTAQRLCNLATGLKWVLTAITSATTSFAVTRLLLILFRVQRFTNSDNLILILVPISVIATLGTWSAELWLEDYVAAARSYFCGWSRYGWMDGP